MTYHELRLTTSRLVLRDVEETDLEALHRLQSDPELVRFQNHRLRTREQTAASLKVSLEAARRQPRVDYDLAVLCEGRLIGNCGLELHTARRQPRCYEAGLWYALERASWGRGFATEAGRALVRHGFEALGLHRIFVEADPANPASIAVARRLGLSEEGCFRQNRWFKGSWCDTVILAMLELDFVAQPGDAR